MLRIEPAPAASLAPVGLQSLTPSHLVVLRAALADPIETIASDSRVSKNHGRGGHVHLIAGVPDLSPAIGIQGALQAPQQLLANTPPVERRDAAK